MNLSSPAEQQNLERTAQEQTLKKNLEIQKARHKELQRLYIPNCFNKNMARLQCRSYPLGVFIILDSRHTDFVTPHTFELEPGKHEIQMDYVEPTTGEVISKKEVVELVKNKRSVCKIRFLEPKTLADATELSR